MMNKGHALSDNAKIRFLQLMAEGGETGLGRFTTIGSQKDVIIEVYTWDDDYHEGVGFIVEYDWDYELWIYYEAEMRVKDINTQDLVTGTRYFAKWNGIAACMTSEPALPPELPTVCQKVVMCNEEDEIEETYWLKIYGERFETEEECMGDTDGGTD